MRRLAREGLAIVAGSLILGGCAQSDDPGSAYVVARVGDRNITKAEVDHWEGAVKRGGVSTGLRGSPRAVGAKEKALTLLISSSWLIGEAERRGLAISPQDVRAARDERAAGRSEAVFRQWLGRRGQTIAGLEFELRAELAFEALLRDVGEHVGRISRAEIEDYYDQHKSLFSTPEARVVDIVEELPSAAAAKALVRRAGTGPEFTRAAYHKQIAHTVGVFMGPVDKKRVDSAIFSARVGLTSRPMPLEGGWSVFVVRKVVPPKLEALSKVQNRIIEELGRSRPRKLRAEFGREFTTRWRAETSCRDGYVAPGCSQDRGVLGEYEDPFNEGS